MSNLRLRPTGLVTIVQGAQYGSESKGIATAHLVLHSTFPTVYAVRTGAINAGHTVHYQGHVVKMQQLPVGWVRPDAQLALGPGAMIHLPTLRREMELIDSLMPEHAPVARRLSIDYRAGIHEDHHMDLATQANRHHLIGATGKGCSEAMVSRIRDRARGFRTIQQVQDLPPGIELVDVPAILNRAVDHEAEVILEATQGHLLDLLTGPYPYTTHKPTSPAQWMVECSLSPSLPNRVVLVVRTYPIRVAGNSGPMPGEISWSWLARNINRLLESKGYDPRVPESAIREFEMAVINEAANFRIPAGATGLDQHTWTDKERVECRVALSDLHAVALATLPPTTIEQLSRLFEFTTVTKKLRRVADINYTVLNHVGQEARPESVFLTFANYISPWLWDLPADANTNAAHSGVANDHQLGITVRNVEHATGAMVRWVNTGPGQEHVHDLYAE